MTMSVRMLAMAACLCVATASSTIVGASLGDANEADEGALLQKSLPDMLEVNTTTAEKEVAMAVAAMVAEAEKVVTVKNRERSNVGKGARRRGPSPTRRRRSNPRRRSPPRRREPPRDRCDKQTMQGWFTTAEEACTICDQPKNCYTLYDSRNSCYMEGLVIDSALPPMPATFLKLELCATGMST